MREVVSIKIGQCGNQIGNSFWQGLCDEHGIDPSGTYNGDSDLQLDQIDVFLKEMTGNRFVPRSIFTDLDPGTLDSIRAGPYAQLYPTSNFVFGKYGTGCCWANGFYNEGSEMIDTVLDAIRSEAESCESLQGFQLVHGLGGGTGSGMGSLLLDKLKDEFPNKLLTTFSVLPSAKMSDTVVEPYNAVLALHYLTERADMCLMFDNEAVYNVARRHLSRSHASSELQSTYCVLHVEHHITVAHPNNKQQHNENNGYKSHSIPSTALSVFQLANIACAAL